MDNTINEPLVNTDINWNEAEEMVSKHKDKEEWDEIVNLIRTNKLATELYEDLKEKYIIVKTERDNLYINTCRLFNKVKKLLKPLKYGRNQFNFAVKLSTKQVEEYCRVNQLDLNIAVGIVKVIQELKKPPLTEVKLYNNESTEQ